jgi:hypothetical protein
MVIAGSSETLINTSNIKRLKNPEDQHLDLRLRENVKFHVYFINLFFQAVALSSSSSLSLSFKD